MKKQFSIKLTLGFLLLFTIYVGYYFFQTPVDSTISSLSNNESSANFDREFHEKPENKKNIYYIISSEESGGKNFRKQFFFNTTWAGRNRDFQGRTVHYQFGGGNPSETNKTAEEIKKMSMECRTKKSVQDNNCENILSNTELGATSGDDNAYKVPIMTPEIEYLVYSFLSNPIIRQSSEACAIYFWSNDRIAHILYPNEDIGEVSPNHWWNPYRIDINDFIVINPNTGRKELETQRIWTLNTQINSPLTTSQYGGNYINKNLTECLEKNNQLYPLQSHVSVHYERLLRAWRGI